MFSFIIYFENNAINVTVNMALLRPAVVSGDWSNDVASLAVDGNLATVACTEPSTEPWLSVDLGEPMDVGRVCVVNDHDTEHG